MFNKDLDNKKKIYVCVRVSLLLGLLLFLSLEVSSLAITPGRTSVDFKPGLEKNIDLRIINNENKQANLLISSRGNLSSFISIENETVSLSPGESGKVFFNLDLPQELPYGTNKGGIVVLEVPGDKSVGELRESGSYVEAVLAVVSQLHVQVPYPGRYAESDLSIESGRKKADFYIPITNKGRFDLKNVRASIDIYNLEGVKIDSFITNSIDVPSGRRKEIVSSWGEEFNPGKYEARVNLIYGKEDGKTLKMNGSFTVGKRALNLENLEVDQFNLGEIAKIEMLVENKWNRKADNVYVDVRVYKNEEKISQFKSSSHDISASSERVLNAYWDTSGIKTGTYDVDVFLRYKNGSVKKDLSFKVTENNIEVFGLGNVVSGGDKIEESSGNFVFFLLLIVVLLILINLFWFLYFRRKIKRKRVSR